MAEDPVSNRKHPPQKNLRKSPEEGHFIEPKHQASGDMFVFKGCCI